MSAIAALAFIRVEKWWQLRRRKRDGVRANNQKNPRQLTIDQHVLKWAMQMGYSYIRVTIAFGKYVRGRINAYVVAK